jgi:uncharacterized protein involved in type VI secretion and phage assembly
MSARGALIVDDHRRNGITLGLVVDLDDPLRLNRVRVQYPLLENAESGWARLVSPMAGKGRGLVMRPEVGDEVLVVFEQADPRRPYVVGQLWSQHDEPPADDGQGPSNNWRFIRSRSGHLIKLDDTAGAERIEIVDKDQRRRIVIDSSGSAIEIECDGAVSIRSGGQILIKGQSLKLEADQGIDVTAQTQLKLSGTTVDIN